MLNREWGLMAEKPNGLALSGTVVPVMIIPQAHIDVALAVADNEMKENNDGL